MPDRSPPDIGRGPRRALSPRARRLVERAATTDRTAQAHARLAIVRAADRRLRARQQLLRVTAWLVLTVTVVGFGALLQGVVGALAGAAIVGLLALLQAGLRRAAARRGASAWDWRARRYRLLGDPAAQVQSLDGYGDTRDALGQRVDRRR